MNVTQFLTCSSQQTHIASFSVSHLFMFTPWNTDFMNKYFIFHCGVFTEGRGWKWAQKWADAASFVSQRYFNEAIYSPLPSEA
jgi:hypothetical protein